MDALHSASLKLCKLLTPATIDLSLRGDDRETVLAELVDHVPGIGRDPEAKRALLRALLARERMCSTGLGNGIALPHTRNSIPGLAHHPVVVFGRHPEGIAYEAIDQAPVRLFFLLLAPTVSQQLQLLARLSRLLRNASFRKSLLAAEKPADVLGLIREAEGKG